MIDHWLREIKDAFIAIFRPILKIDMSPNVLTLLSGAFGLFSCYLCAFDLTFWAFFFWNMNRLFDGLDGYYARQKGMTSDFGGYLDSWLTSQCMRLSHWASAIAVTTQAYSLLRCSWRVHSL